MKIIDADMKYFGRVLELSYENYQRECEDVFLLEGVVKEDLAQSLLKMFANQTLLVYVEEEEVVGYLGYEETWEVESTLFCRVPLFGYGAMGPERSQILSYLFQTLGERLCVKEKLHFEIKIYAHDTEVQQLFSFLQFGIQCEEGVYRYPVKEVDLEEIVIRELKEREKVVRWKEVWGILQQLIVHLRKSPVFYKGEEFMEEAYAGYLQEKSTKVLVAEKEGSIIGILCASKDGNGFLNDKPKWYNIGDIYVDPSYRGSKVAKNMLAVMIRLLSEQGIETYWVEHGTANPNARGFWNKYIQTYAYTMIREIECNW